VEEENVGVELQEDGLFDHEELKLEDCEEELLLPLLLLDHDLRSLHDDEGEGGEEAIEEKDEEDRPSVDDELKLDDDEVEADAELPQLELHPDDQPEPTLESEPRGSRFPL